MSKSQNPKPRAQRRVSYDGSTWTRLAPPPLLPSWLHHPSISSAYTTQSSLHHPCIQRGTWYAKIFRHFAVGPGVIVSPSIDYFLLQFRVNLFGRPVERRFTREATPSQISRSYFLTLAAPLVLVKLNFLAVAAAAPRTLSPPRL